MHNKTKGPTHLVKKSSPVCPGLYRGGGGAAVSIKISKGFKSKKQSKSYWRLLIANSMEEAEVVSFTQRKEGNM
jgi:hypothetical protein